MKPLVRGGHKGWGWRRGDRESFPFTCQPRLAQPLCLFRIKQVCLPRERPWLGDRPCRLGCLAEGHSQGASASPSLRPHSRPQRPQQMVGGSSPSRSLFVQALPVRTFLPATERPRGSLHLLATRLSPPLPGGLQTTAASEVQATRVHTRGWPCGWRALASPFPHLCSASGTLS